jgi:hypothetical protein
MASRKRTPRKTKSRQGSQTKAKAAAAPGMTRQRSAASERLIARVRKICLALPEATEKLAWGEPTWRVRERLFAQIDDHHHGAPHIALWLPAPLGTQEALVSADPERFFRPPYVGHRGWVAVVLDGKPDWAMIADLVEQAYGMVAPPKLQALLAGQLE